MRAWSLTVLVLLLCMSGLLLASCSSYAKFLDGLNARELSSCLRWEGQFSAGTLYGGAVNVRGVTVTGGADLAQCQAAMDAGGRF